MRTGCCSALRRRISSSASMDCFFCCSGGNCAKCVGGVGGDGQQGAQTRQSVLERQAALDEERFQFAQFVGRRLRALETKDHPFEQIDERVERSVAVVRRSLAGSEPRLLVGDVFGQRMHQPGFADPCLTVDQNDLSPALHDLRPAFLEEPTSLDRPTSGVRPMLRPRRGACARCSRGAPGRPPAVSQRL